MDDVCTLQLTFNSYFLFHVECEDLSHGIELVCYQLIILVANDSASLICMELVNVDENVRTLLLFLVKLPRNWVIKYLF